MATLIDRLAPHAFRTWLASYREYRNTRRELQQYTPNELADLNIAPRDIDRIAWMAAFGHRFTAR